MTTILQLFTGFIAVGFIVGAATIARVIGG